jgi:hypothetical protein
MLGLANTWADVYRGTAPDPTGLTMGDEGTAQPIPAELADPDNTDPIIARMPIGLTERSRRVYLPETDELRTIRYGDGRVTGTFDVRKGDRLHDLRTGRWWSVNETDDGGHTIAGTSDLLLDLREV